MKRSMYGVAASLGLALLMASPAAASQKGVNGCFKTFTGESNKAIKGIVAVFKKCENSVQGCFAKTDVAGCIAKANAAGKACDGTATGTLSAGGAKGVGKIISKFGDKITKKCTAAGVGDPTKFTDAEGRSADPNNLAGTLGFGINEVALECTLPLVTDANYAANFKACGQQLVMAKVAAVMEEIDPRGWWVLNAAGVPVAAASNLVPIGTHKVNGLTDSTLWIATGGTPLLGIITKFNVTIGAVAANGLATVKIPQDSVVYSPVSIPGNTVCVKQPADGKGILCCAAAGCPAALNKSYDVCQDHDSSGGNGAFGFGGDSCKGGVANAACNDFTTNTVSTLTSTISNACQETIARPGACNKDNVGTKDTKSHDPRCLGGLENGQICSPGVSGCGGGLCPPGQLGGMAPTMVPLCNSPVTVTQTASPFGNGDMAIGTTIQFTVIDQSLDGVNFPGACVNMAGDMIPDGYGCDGLPCTADDTTPPGTPAQIALTTGTATVNLFNFNAIPGGPSNNFPPSPGTPVGATGAAASCHKLSASITAGVRLAGAFDALDNTTFGDSDTTILQKW